MLPLNLKWVQKMNFWRRELKSRPRFKSWKQTWNTGVKNLAHLTELKPQCADWGQALTVKWRSYGYSQRPWLVQRWPQYWNGPLRFWGSYASIEPKKRGGLKMLVLDTVVKNKGQLVSSTEVERLLLQSGYKPSGKHFDISVYQTLQRLADKKLINRIKDGSKVRFASKSE